jgi:phytoene dehydrogenase-like protein
MAGLSTAVYARLSGLSVRVFEQHSIPGGLCTAWKRKGYVFDYCIDYFVGSNKDVDLYEIWKELGVIDGRRFLHIDSFGRFFELYTDHRRLRDHMLNIAPEDTGKISEFCAAIGRARYRHGRFPYGGTHYGPWYDEP